MIEIDAAWLAALNIGNGDKEREQLAMGAFDELSLRIGNILAEKLTEAQLDEFSGISDEDEKLAWLEKAYPSYKKIARSEFKKLEAELKAAADPLALLKSWAAS